MKPLLFSETGISFSTQLSKYSSSSTGVRSRISDIVSLRESKYGATLSRPALAFLSLDEDMRYMAFVIFIVSWTLLILVRISLIFAMKSPTCSLYILLQS